MLNYLIQFFLRARMAAILLGVVLLVGGYFAYRNITIEAFPDPTDTQVQVITIYPGQPTEEVERRVSLPLERALNGTPGLIGIRSISLFGLSFVTTTFSDAIDPMLARQQALERIGQADLPQGVQPSLGPMATPIGEVYRYTLEGESSDPMSLRTLQDWTVRPAILRVQGVADVVSYGGLLQEIHVTPDPTKMAALGVAITDIFSALKKASDNATGGYVERGSETFVIRSLGTFREINEIEEVRISYHDGVPVMLRDVARVSVGYAPRQGVVTRNADEDAVQGIVLMRRGGNPSAVLAALRAQVADIQDHWLPKGVRIHPFYDRTDLVDTTLRTVFHNIIEGAVLVVLVLFAFMLSVRASLIVAVVIPLSLGASFIYLYSRGMSANLLSIGAVDFGIIVDGAVILVEIIFHNVSERADAIRARATTVAEVVYESAREVARPTVFSLLIIIAAYLPIFALQRVEGRIFGPMAHTVVSALLGALVMTFSLVPVLCLFALRKPKNARESFLLRFISKVYDPSLRLALENPAAILIFAIAMLAGTVILLPKMGTEFLPQLNEGSLYATLTGPSNMSLTEGRKLTPKIKEKIARTPEVVELQTQLGRPEDGTDATLPNNLEVFIKLKPMDQWRSSMHTIDDIASEIDRSLDEIPGVESNISQPIRDNVNENIAGQFGEIAMKIYGYDLERLQSVAEKAKSVLAGVAGVADLGIVKSGEMPQVAIHLNREALARYDLDLGDVQDYIETAMGGHTASEFWEGEKRFDVTVRLPQAAREDLHAIQRIQIPLKDGTVIPLSGVADVSMGTGRAVITRENGQRYVGLRMNVHDRDLGSFVAEARGKVDDALKSTLPAGYTITWGGEFENQQRAMNRLQLVVPLSLIITFLLLFSAFGKVWDCILVLLNVPFAFIGGVAALLVAGMPISVSAAIGFIALLGQSVLNGVLLLTAIQSRRAAGANLYDSVTGGARDRLRGILMTGLLASLGLLPAALSRAIGSETQRPLATVVVGGTVTAFLLTLILMPVTYYWSERLRAALAAKFAPRERLEVVSGAAI
ncbi:MAG: efflux RND transporter permease subunit [Planctomycetes bacterium]|nr:efflux RND transporter permease subunit [Planctomycetota bacterium]